MKYIQSHVLRRKIEVRAMAVIFLYLGVWYLWLFFSPFFVVSRDKTLNPVLLIYTSFLLTAGINLFRLKQSGRDLTLTLLSIRAIINVFLLLWLLVQKLDNHNQSVAASTITVSAWLFVVILMIVFLLQRETKEVFSIEENLVTT